jgi:poly(3-hydroxybutyrate) depolymerase
LALASLSASALACKQDPATSSSFIVAAAATGGGGSTGAAGTPATGGSTGAAGTTTTADGGMTVGCNANLMQPLGSYFEYHVSIAGPDIDSTTKQPKVRDRTYWVRLPTNYDSTMPNRVVYLGPGCGGSSWQDVLRINTNSMNDAILVAVIPLAEFGACFDESANSVEVPYFDAVHKAVESAFCVDPSRQFYAGFSTGARLGYMLNCYFPDVLRATGPIQGGLPSLSTCKNKPIAMMTVSDTTETGNPYSQAVKATQNVFTQNGCTGMFVSPMPPADGKATVAFDPMATPLMANTPVCVKYAGCPDAYPVVFCSTTNAGHVTYEPWSDQALWNFFKSF